MRNETYMRAMLDREISQTHPVSFLLLRVSTCIAQLSQRDRSTVGQFWPKVEDDILQTISLTTVS